MNELNKPPDHFRKADRSRILRISRDHPFYVTSNKGNISEARLVMANHLGRNLTKDDIVYHKNDDCNDNKINNLIVITRREFATIRDWKRLKRRRNRIESQMSVYEQYMADAGIDHTTLDRSFPNDRYRDVDKDRESYDISRIGRDRGDLEE